MDHRSPDEGFYAIKGLWTQVRGIGMSSVTLAERLVLS